MHPLHVRKEIDAFIADRLMEALWREALWLIEEDVATAEEIDDAIRFGPGIRWSFMGTLLIYRIAGGEEGMRHFLAQFGPSLKWPWTKLMDVPELTERLIDKVAAQSDAQAKGVSIRELERKRDDCLVAVMQALKTQGYGAGATLLDYEKRLYEKAHRGATEARHDYQKPLRLFEINVPQDWTDYNNHMNESRYLQMFTNCSDALLRLIGSDDEYNRKGFSYYTAETHIMHMKEVAALEPVHVTVQVIAYDEKRLHVFYRLFHSRTDDLLATGEQIYLHVDGKAGKTVAAPKKILDRIAAIWDGGHKSLPRPEAVGRHVGQRKG
jgi:carnitine 3-dehydrogenase